MRLGCRFRSGGGLPNKRFNPTPDVSRRLQVRHVQVKRNTLGQTFTRGRIAQLHFGSVLVRTLLVLAGPGDGALTLGARRVERGGLEHR